MIFAGIQNLTLLDYPGKLACTLFTHGCNFRCPFCHNASLVTRKQEQTLTQDAVFEFLRRRKGTLDGVVVTGGEPLMHPQLAEFLQQVKDLGFLVKLDTNGSFPERLKALVGAGLVDKVAMDIKNSPDLYAKTIGTDRIDFAEIDASREFLMQGNVEYEFRTTVVKGLHTAQSLEDAAKWIAGADAYFLQQFIDSGDLLDGQNLENYNAEQMQAFLNNIKNYVPNAALRGL